MDFSQTRLKLRVAVCPYMVPTGPEYHHRIVGMKREAGNNVSLVILRQFLLLLPLDCTFADLNTRVTHQYDKLYQYQPAYVPIKNIVLFRDSNQCDLDLDYLVSDICASNDLIYAMVEVDESSKKIKITNEKVVSAESPVKQQQKSQPENIKSNQNQIKQNEKKVPEFKPTPVKAPTVKQVPVKNTNESKPNEIAKPVVKPVDIKPIQDTKVVDVKAHEIKMPEKKVTETKVEEKKAVEVKVPETMAVEEKPVDSKVLEVKVTETKPAATPISKPTAKKIQKQVEEPIKPVTESPSDLKVSEASVKEASKAVVSENLMVEPNTNITYAEAVVASSEISSEGKRSTNMITPVPTPVSRPIFNPRKSETPTVSSSSSDEEGNDSVLNNFDATNLFGPQVITSEPRRSDAFVLFAARSSDDSGVSSDENENIVSIPTVPLKSSSIVSLQAAPSSDFCEEDSESESEKETNEQLLPHSVTMRRLSSVSPIPDSSEIPSLSELKESINRAPTPIQIVQQQQQQQQQQKQHHHQHNDNNLKTTKGGRPSKKQNTGRPKKVPQKQQQ